MHALVGALLGAGLAGCGTEARFAGLMKHFVSQAYAILTTLLTSH